MTAPQALARFHHGRDKTGIWLKTLSPRAGSSRRADTKLTDGEIHYIIENGAALTGMLAWGNPNQAQNDDSWKLVLYSRSLRPPMQQEQVQEARTSASAHYVGSLACQECDG